jgi:hypothetical protein
MEKTLKYFKIDGAVGGNQDWFRNVVMKMGGCAAATACDSCIYFSLHQGQKHLYPYDVNNLSKEDYIKFSMIMKPYIRPRVGGVKKLSMFIDGISRYLNDRNDKRLQVSGFEGGNSAGEAEVFIKNQIDHGFPVPYLMLKHKKAKFKDFVWHWFLCFGYEERKEGFFIKVATYGGETNFLLKDLWETGFEEKGGLIQFAESMH